MPEGLSSEKSLEDNGDLLEELPFNKDERDALKLLRAGKFSYFGRIITDGASAPDPSEYAGIVPVNEGRNSEVGTNNV